MTRLGVRTRLALTTAAVTAAAMAAMLLLVLLAANELSRSQVDASLRDRIVSVQATLQLRDGRLVAPPTQADEVLDTVWIFDTEGREVSGPEAGARVTARVDELSAVQAETRIERGDRVYLARPVTIGPSGRAAGVAVATESLETLEDNRNLLLAVLAAASLVVVAGTAGLTAWSVGRTLRPVREMTEAADEWSASNLESRFGLTGKDEFAHLGRTLDRLLDRVARAIRSEQQLTGELAHELRTPLTAIRGEAELAVLDPASGPSAERFTRIVEQVDRLSTTITTLLDVARHAAEDGGRADVGAVVRDLVVARPRGGPAIEVVAVPGLHAGAAPELLERAIAPVLDNAVRHATGRVVVTVRRGPDGVEVAVEDDGAGIADEDLDRIFTAGFSLAADVGVGLGLALARRVARSMGGSVEVSSPRNPTVVVVSVPAS